MGGGKSLEIMLEAHHNSKIGYNTLIAKPSKDKKAGEMVETRFGEMRKDVDLIFCPEDDVRNTTVSYIGKRAVNSNLWIAYIDEAQFLEPEQVLQLRQLVDHDGIAVEAYGLRSDFQTKFFPGSEQLFLNADVIVPPTREAICGEDECTRTAVHNMRLDNGVPTFEGEQVAIDGIDNTYKPVCSKHYHGHLGDYTVQ